jgi:hypothetical protein
MDFALVATEGHLKLSISLWLLKLLKPDISTCLMCILRAERACESLSSWQQRLEARVCESAGRS